MPPEPPPAGTVAAPILVVEDNEVNATILRAMLRKHGYEPILAKTGEEGGELRPRRRLGDPGGLRRRGAGDRRRHRQRRGRRARSLPRGRLRLGPRQADRARRADRDGAAAPALTVRPPRG